jgi:hypothetical protein
MSRTVKHDFMMLRKMGLSVMKYVLSVSVGLSFLTAFLMATQSYASDWRTVASVQVILNSHGYNVGDVDGVAGPATRRALQSFALVHSIEPTVRAFYEYAVSRNLQERVPISDEGYLDSIRDSVSANLRDPSSAQFRNIYAITGPSVVQGSDRTYVCGQVNARNAFGGYAGFQYFYGTQIVIGENRNHFLFWSIDGPDRDLAEMFCTLTFRR